MRRFILAPGQRTYRDAGLPRARDIPDRHKRPAPALLEVAPGDGARAIAERLLRGRAWRDVPTPLGSRRVDARSAAHLSLDPARAPFVPHFLQALRTPDEVWLVEYVADDGRVQLREHYIAYFRISPLRRRKTGTVCVVQLDGLRLLTAFPDRNVDARRLGVLLYLRGRR